MMRTRPYKTCLCAPDKPCAACPLAHHCGCGARVGQRCQRPSGHRGNFVMTHEDRLLRSDVDAIVRDPAEVEARLRAQRNNPDDMRLWARALRGLTRRPALWQGRVDPAVIEQLAALAEPSREDPGRRDDHEQLRLEMP